MPDGGVSAPTGEITGLPPSTSADKVTGIRQVVASLRGTGEAPEGFYQHPDIHGPVEFMNNKGLLPTQDAGYYYEWDVHPYQGDAMRGIERLVTGSNGEIYFTPNHYTSFYAIEVP
jgi:guanyl-specific ribonuclease Sa